MALITCYECSREISETAHSCPGCGAPVRPVNRVSRPNQHPYSERRVSLPLFLGIVVLAPIFSWFLLRKGHTNFARVCGFAWLAAFIFFPTKQTSSPDKAESTQAAYSSGTNYSTTQSIDQHPESTATYAQLNTAVGCKSTYSDQKKEDIFRTNYKDHWMTWSGEVVLLESDQASLNVDGVGTQDLRVVFADEQAGYNLSKGSQLKVRFLMKSAGGCFLPFSGREAVIVQ